MPGFSMMQALGTARRISCGLGMTAASAIISCSIKALSSSKGLMR